MDLILPAPNPAEQAGEELGRHPLWGNQLPPSEWTPMPSLRASELSPAQRETEINRLQEKIDQLKIDAGLQPYGRAAGAV